MPHNININSIIIFILKILQKSKTPTNNLSICDTQYQHKFDSYFHIENFTKKITTKNNNLKI